MRLNYYYFIVNSGQSFDLASRAWIRNRDQLRDQRIMDYNQGNNVKITMIFQFPLIFQDFGDCSTGEFM